VHRLNFAFCVKSTLSKNHYVNRRPTVCRSNSGYERPRGHVEISAFRFFNLAPKPASDLRRQGSTVERQHKKRPADSSTVGVFRGPKGNPACA
jgi:hypothetical protein